MALPNRFQKILKEKESPVSTTVVPEEQVIPIETTTPTEPVVKERPQVDQPVEKTTTPVEGVEAIKKESFSDLRQRKLKEIKSSSPLIETISNTQDVTTKETTSSPSNTFQDIVDFLKQTGSGRARTATTSPLQLRVLEGFAKTDDDKLATIRKFTKDPNAAIVNGDIEYTDQVTGKKIRLNEETGFTGDILQEIGPTLDAGLMTTGATLGGSASFGLAAATGAEAGSQIYDLISNQLGVVDKRSVTKKIADAAVDITSDALLDNIFTKAVKATKGAAAKTIRWLTDPNTDLYDALVKSGIDPIGAWESITRNPFAQKVQRISRELPFGKKIRNSIDKTSNSIKKQALDMTELTGSPKIHEKFIVGGGVERDISSIEKANSRMIGTVRNNLKKKVGDSKIPLNKFREDSIDMLREYEGMSRLDRNSFFSPKIKTYLDGIALKANNLKSKRNIKGKLTAQEVLEFDSSKLDKELIDSLDEGFNFDTLVQMRSEILSEARGTRDKQLKRRFENIAGSIEADITDYLEKNVGGNSAKAFSGSSRLYKKQQDQFDNDLSKIIKDTSEKTYDSLVKDIIKSPKTMEGRLKRISKKSRAELSRFFLESMMAKQGDKGENLFNVDQVFGGGAKKDFDVNYFLGNYNSLNKESKGVLFNGNKEVISTIDNFASLIKEVKSADSRVLNTGTPAGNFIIRLLQTPGAAGAAAFTAMNQGVALSPATVGAGVGTAGTLGFLYLNSRLMSSPEFMKAVIKGAKTANLDANPKGFFNTIQNVAKRSPGIREDIRHFIESSKSFIEYEGAREDMGKRKTRKTQRRQRRPQPESQMLGVRG